MPDVLAMVLAFIDRLVPASASRRRELRILLSGSKRSGASLHENSRIREDATLIPSTLSSRQMPRS